MLDEMYGKSKRPLNSFQLFCHKYVRQVKSEKARVSRKRILEVYGRWCENEGLPVISSIKVAPFIKAMGWVKKFNAQGSVIYQGLSMTTNK